MVNPWDQIPQPVDDIFADDVIYDPVLKDWRKKREGE